MPISILPSYKVRRSTVRSVARQMGADRPCEDRFRHPRPSHSLSPPSPALAILILCSGTDAHDRATRERDTLREEARVGSGVPLAPAPRSDVLLQTLGPASSFTVAACLRQHAAHRGTKAMATPQASILGVVTTGEETVSIGWSTRPAYDPRACLGRRTHTVTPTRLSLCRSNRSPQRRRFAEMTAPALQRMTCRLGGAKDPSLVRSTAETHRGAPFLRRKYHAVLGSLG